MNLYTLDDLYNMGYKMQQWTKDVVIAVNDVHIPKVDVSFSHSDMGCHCHDRLGRTYNNILYFHIPNHLLTVAGTITCEFYDGSTLDITVTPATKPLGYSNDRHEDTDITHAMIELLVPGVRPSYNNVLWSGGMYMTADHTATLTEAISKQHRGIVLIFSPYFGGVADYDFFSYFIPKEFVALHPGGGFDVAIIDGEFRNAAGKYLYVNDTTIKGHDNNGWATRTGSTGIKHMNSMYVLRYVIGV